MKKTAWTVIFLFLLSGIVYSAPAVPPQAGASAPEAARIGVVAAVQGAVKIGRSDLAGKIVQSGQPVYLGDEVSTGDKGSLQILLLDETVFTIGPNSSIVIDKFIYDPASEAGQVNATVVIGVFRFVTGKIARKKPSDMKVDLPSGTIGVRGTIVAGETNGKSSTIILLGPGAKTNTNHRIGQITVGNEAGGKFKEVTVTRPGFGTRIDGPGIEPAAPFLIPEQELDKIMQSLEAEPSQSGTPDTADETRQPSGNPTEQAGQDRASAGQLITDLSRAGKILKKLSSETDKASQEAISDDQTVRDGVARYDELRRVQTGTFHYSQSSVPLRFVGTGMLSGDTYDFDMDINFGAKTVGGDVATNKITVNLSPNNAQYQLDTKSFAEGNQQAVFVFNQVPDSGPCTACSVANILVGLNNRDGVIADNARHSIAFNDGLNNQRGEDVTPSRHS